MLEDIGTDEDEEQEEEEEEERRREEKYKGKDTSGGLTVYLEYNSTRTDRSEIYSMNSPINNSMILPIKTQGVTSDDVYIKPLKLKPNADIAMYNSDQNVFEDGKKKKKNHKNIEKTVAKLYGNTYVLFFYCGF